MRDSKEGVLRALDANLNRSREGLRVCEEIFRFYSDQGGVAAQLKAIRHSITDAIKAMPVSYRSVLAARDVAGDRGRRPSPLEKKRLDVLDLFLANLERSKEALRVLEEFSKLLDSKTSDRFKKIRFKVYAIEKQALPKLEALCHHRPIRRPSLSVAGSGCSSAGGGRSRDSAAR